MLLPGISKKTRLTGSSPGLPPPSSALPSDCEIGDNGACSLAEALKQNIALTTLDLGGKSE